MKIFKFVLAVICICLTFCSCRKSLNYVIDNEESVKGVVSETTENSITIDVNDGEDELNSSDVIVVSLNVQYKDSVTHFNVGDEVAVYYDGMLAETYPAQINSPYVILLVTPRERE